ncbi:hypothetical protein [Rhizobium leguminosarum]|uniref:hypothetical protein n=1 Tax=Rhizobium leguminosarum TaxID=384 RepID=UPI001FEDCBD8|nr:hypothetical protein [Rhizobium leguminosarum]
MVLTRFLGSIGSTGKIEGEFFSAVREVWVERACFNYQTQAWARVKYKLPWVNGNYVILSPKDMLTRDENWINKEDLIDGFENIPTAIPDMQLRASVFNYFETELKRRPKPPGKKQPEPTKKERAKAAVATMRKFPQIIDYYIRLKEEHGDDASDVSAEKVLAIEYMFIEQLRSLGIARCRHQVLRDRQIHV